MSFRGFISADIEPNDQLVRILDELAASRADIKVVKPDLLHVTLKFLGQTEENVIPDIESRMAAVCLGQPAFRIRLKGTGAFPSLSNIRVVWVGIENAEPLGKIAGALESLLSELGFKEEKRGFKPHLTLARMRSGRNMGMVQEILKTNAASEMGEYLIDRINLKKSVLSPQGPSYSTLYEQRL